MDGFRRTHPYALLAKTASVEVNIGTVVLYRNGSERTLFLAFATTDAAHLAGFHRNGSLVLVDAADKDTTALWTFLAQFDDASRTGFCAGTTGRTLLFIHLRQTSLVVEVYGIKLAGVHTVAAP